MEKLVGQMIINKLPEDNVVVGEDLALFSFKHFIDELEANDLASCSVPLSCSAPQEAVE